MSPFRRFSRRFWPLHAYLMISMILWPVPPARSYWTDSNEDGVKEWVDEAGLAPIWWDADSDSDGLTNVQEALYGSDPYAKDSDRDGLSDLVERDYTPPSAPFDPWSWDTDGDGYSDHDEYYFMIQGSPLVVHYPSLSGPFYDYRDTDGDGLLNYDDSDPTGMDRDGDGLLNWQDPYMDDANNGAGTGYTPPPMDSDFDGIPDESDPFPWGSYWYDGIEYGGSWSDNDGDGIPNPADAYPNGSFTYNGVEYAGLWSDMDWDGIPDPADSFPYSSTTYWFNGLEYPGSWQDSDWDGIPDPADGWPNDRWNGQPYFTYNGSEYPGAWEDRDGDGVPDAADSWPDDPENGADDDNDGLSNYDERTQHFTDPAKVDTDHDWLTDYEELYVFHTNPKAPRSGLASGQTLLDGQLHLGADTDGDDLPDVLEDYYASLGYGLDKNDPADGAGDLDSDGYTNAQAFTFGWSLIANRGTYDQDGDGIDDAVEDFWAALYPGSMDKTVFEDAVADHDQDGLMNYEEVVRHNINGWLLPADPGDPHSLMRTLGYEVVQGTTPNDGQFMRWWWDVSRADYGGVDNGNPVPADATLLDVNDVDPDPNGLPDGYERWLAVVGPETNTARAILADEDDDGMPNVWEHRHRFDPRDDTDAVSPFGGVTVPPLVMPNANDPVFYTDNGSGPEFVQAWYDSAMAAYEADLPAHNQLLAQIGKMDPDGDQLANLDEYLHGTHPRIADSDHDGFEDGAELQNGSDPLLAASVPPVVLSVVSGGGQSITAGLAAPKLLVVKASQGGIPRVGSPVTFASTDQRLSLNNGATTLTLLADEAGNATIAIAGASGAAVGAASVQVTAPEVAAALSVSFTLTPATGGGGGSGGGGGGGGPGGPVPTPFSTPPPQYHLFTAKRERSVKYSGTETPSHPTNSREIGGSTEWFKQAETTPPPNFSDDGFNGDADLQGDNEDPGDPRDDLGSTGKYSEVPATEGEPGAYSIENTVTASTNVGPFSGTKTTNGMYTAQNAYPNPGPDDLKQKHASTFFTYGEAVTRLGDVAYQRGDASNGWQGNGPLGIKSYQVMSTHTINSSTLTIEYFDEESGEVLEDSAVVRSCSGRVEQAEVRLQTNTPVDAAHPARMTYSLFKRAISSSGETYTNQATIELSISSGQVSDTATVLSGTLPAEVQAQSGLITMTSPAVSEGEMAAWVLVPADLILDNNNIAYRPDREALGVSNYVTNNELPATSQFNDTNADPENFRLQARLSDYSTMNSVPMTLEVLRGSTVITTINYILANRDGDFVRGNFLRLVTDTNDDAESNDQTILVKLGDKIKVSYEIAAGSNVEQEIQVGRPSSEDNNEAGKPWKHDIREVKCRFVVFGNAATEAQIDQEIDTLNERYAQCGVRMNVVEKKLNVPLPAEFAGGGFTRGGSPIQLANADERELVKVDTNGHHVYLDDDNNTVDFMYVPDLNDGFGHTVRATAYRAGRNATGNAAFQNFVVVGPTRSELSVAHELMHVLLNISHRQTASGAYLDASTALFHPTTTKAVDGTKRIGPYPAAASGVGNDDTTTIRNNAEQLP